MDGLETFLHELCDAAERETMPRFRMRLDIQNKDQAGFDPVTEADRAAELAIRTLVERRFPDHGFVGEEHGKVREDARHVWIVDPVDGTRAFICGLPSWGTLIGLTEGGRPVAGVMAQPFTGERYIACDGEAFLWRNGERRKLATSATARLSDAVMMTTSPYIFAPEIIGRYRAVEKACRMTRYGFDCYAYAMVAAGNIDLVVESGLQAYDIAPLIPLIEAAGGVVTTWEGADAANGGSIIAAANAAIHAQALALLAAG